MIEEELPNGELRGRIGRALGDFFQRDWFLDPPAILLDCLQKQGVLLVPVDPPQE